MAQKKGIARADFPLFSAYPRLVYLDSAATTLLPESVAQAQDNWYRTSQAPIHRSVYSLAAAATGAYEAVREQARALIGAGDASEIIFTHHATEGLNLAACIEEQRLKGGDEIILSRGEHHSLILPLQRLAARTGARIIWLPGHEQGSYPFRALKKAFSKKTKLVALASVSNVLGYIAPLEKISQLCAAKKARLLLDAAQSVPVTSFDFSNTPVTYAAFSGHKMYAPDGSGFIYIRADAAAAAEPFLVGGGAISRVTEHSTEWAPSPARFEAGSPNSAGVAGLGAALVYVQKKNIPTLQKKLFSLTEYGLEQLSAIPGLTLYGPAASPTRAPIFSFSLKSSGKFLHSHDIAQILDERHIAVRGGHHCAQMLVDDLGVADLTRASCGIYTEKSDIDLLVEGLQTVVQAFS